MSNGRQRGQLPPPRPVEQRQKARQIWESGESIEATARELNIPAATIRTWKKRDGNWTRKSDELPIAPTPAAAIGEGEDIPETLPEQVEDYETSMRRAAVTFARYVSGLPGEQIAQKSDKIYKGDATSRRALRIDGEMPRCVIQIGVLAQPTTQRSIKDAKVLGPSERQTLTLNEPTADATP